MKVDCSVKTTAENLAKRKVGMNKHLAGLKAPRWMIQTVGLKADHWVIQMEPMTGFQMALKMALRKMRLLSKTRVSHY